MWEFNKFPSLGSLNYFGNFRRRFRHGFFYKYLKSEMRSVSNKHNTLVTYPLDKKLNKKIAKVQELL